MLWYWLWVWSPGIFCLFAISKFFPFVLTVQIRCVSCVCVCVCLIVRLALTFRQLIHTPWFSPIDQKKDDNNKKKRKTATPKEPAIRCHENNKVECFAIAKRPFGLLALSNLYKKLWLCCRREKKTARGTSFQSYYRLFITIANESWIPFFFRHFFSRFVWMLWLFYYLKCYLFRHRAMCAS